MSDRSPFCQNSRRWLILAGWNLWSCPYEDKMRNACVDCGYYKEKRVTQYYRRKLKAKVE